MLREPVFFWELHLRGKKYDQPVAQHVKDLIWNDLCWETDLELNDERSPFIGIPVDWHALVLNTFDVVVLDYFSWKEKKKAVNMRTKQELQLRMSSNR